MRHVDGENDDSSTQEMLGWGQHGHMIKNAESGAQSGVIYASVLSVGVSVARVLVCVNLHHNLLITNQPESRQCGLGSL